MRFTPAPLEDPFQADSAKSLVARFSEGGDRRPLFLFITGRDPKSAKGEEYIRKNTFKDERVCLGAKFFRLTQVSAGEITKSHPLYKIVGGRRLPRIVLLSRDGKTHRKLEGRISAGRLFGAMSSIVRKDYKRSLGSFATKMRKLLNELDKLEGAKRRLENQAADLSKKGRKSSKAKLLAKKEALLETKTKALEEKMKELLAWTVPPSEKTAKND